MKAIVLAFLLSAIVVVDAALLRHGGKPAEAAVAEKKTDAAGKKEQHLQINEIRGLSVSFEIRNYDYFGLTDAWSDPWANEITKVGDVAQQNALLQVVTRECWRPSDALVKQIIENEASPLTMMDALRTAIKTAVTGAIECEQEESSEDKKPARSNIHVTFRPGNEQPNLSLLSESQKTPMLNKPRASFITTKATQGKEHWSVIVDVVVTDRPKNDVNDLKDSEKFLKKALVSGQLKDSLRGAMYEVTGNAPDVRRIETTSTPIKQWNIDKCEKHISKIVNTFTLHYTRAQVPMALYNECTNFMPKMSFSRDHILDSVDTLRCRKATNAFKKKWKFGKHAKPQDFQMMCMEACEAKYGAGAPLCHVTVGDKLKEQPKF